MDVMEKRNLKTSQINPKASLLLAATFFAIAMLPSWLAAQSGGAVEVEVTTVSYGGNYADKNVGVIWVANSSGQFVKTLKLWAKKRKQHLTQWSDASGENDVDAVTSATLRSHESHVATWNCTDVSGAVVPDGTYRIMIEFTEDNSASSGKPPSQKTKIEFAKNGSSQTVSPPDESYFKSMKVVYSAGGAPPPQHASLSGSVIDDGSGSALSGVAIELKSGSSVLYEAQTNGQGNFSLTGVNAGSYTVAASRQDFQDWTGSISLAAGENRTGYVIRLQAVQTSDTTPPDPPQNVHATRQ